MLLIQRKLIMRVTVMSQFGYCLLVSMSHNRTLHNQINSIHEKAVQLVCKDFKSSINKLLGKANFVTTHQ